MRHLRCGARNGQLGGPVTQNVQNIPVRVLNTLLIILNREFAYIRSFGLLYEISVINFL